MNEERGTILVSATADTLKAQGCLYGRIANESGDTGEAVAVEAETFDEEIGVIEACDGEARQCLHHVGMEVPTIFEVEACRLRREGICIESRRDIGIETMKVVELLTGVEHPFCMLKKGKYVWELMGGSGSISTSVLGEEKLGLCVLGDGEYVV